MAELVSALQKPAERANAGPATHPVAPLDPKAVTPALNESAWNVIQLPPDDAAVLVECLLKAGADPHNGVRTGEVLLHGLAFRA